MARTRKGYFEHSQSLAVSFVLILPLLAAYEVGMIVFRPPAASWAGDAIMWLLNGAFGRGGAIAFNMAVIVAITASLIAMHKMGGVEPATFPLVLGESLVYGALLTQVLPLFVMYALPLAQNGGGAPASVADRMVLSVGAGVYEEIVFRLGLMSAIYFLALKATERNWLAVVVAMAASSVLFAACHYLGGFDLASREFVRSFSYRTVSGAVFAALYIYRGLAVACYTHAFYDVLVQLSAHLFLWELLSPAR